VPLTPLAVQSFVTTGELVDPARLQMKREALEKVESARQQSERFRYSQGPMNRVLIHFGLRTKFWNEWSNEK